MSKEEVEAIVAPHSESLDLVNEWLASHGLTDDQLVRSPAKDWAYIKVPISKAEEMLDTVSAFKPLIQQSLTFIYKKYHIWLHPESGDTVVRTTSYSLPENLHNHIDLVQPTTMFARFKSMRSTLKESDFKITDNEAPASALPAIVTAGTKVDASCNSTITVPCLQQLYQSVGYKPTATHLNKIGITAYLEQYANLNDLQLFYKDQVPAAVNSSFKFISVKGGLNSQNVSEAGVEGNFHIPSSMGWVPNFIMIHS